MKGLWTRTWLLSLILTVPASLAYAQSEETPPAESTEAEETPSEETDEEKKTDEEKEAEEAESDSDAESEEAETPAEADAESEEAETPAEADAETEEAETPAEADAETEEAATTEPETTTETKGDAEEEVAPAGVTAAQDPTAAEATEAALEDAKAEEAEEAATEGPTEGETAEAATAATADGTSTGTGEKKKSKDDALMGASAPVPPDVGRPWQIFATLEQTLGSGAFVANEPGNNTAYGYNVSVAGTWKLGKFINGRADAFGQFTFDQQLTTTFSELNPTPRRFYFRDVTLGVLGRGVLQEKTTGLIFGGNTTISLPTSETSQAADRLFRWGASVNVVKQFKIGPGTLIARLTESFGVNAQPAVANIERDGSCPQTRRDLEACINEFANSPYSFSTTASALFLVGSFSAGISLNLLNARLYDLGAAADFSDSGFTDIRDTPYGRGNNWLNLMAGTISARYAFNQVFSMSAGVTSRADPYFQQGSNNRAVRFPFFDFTSPANNLTQYFLDLNVFY